MSSKDSVPTDLSFGRFFQLVQANLSIFNRDGYCVHMNDSCANLLPWSIETLKQKPLWNCVSSEQQTHIKDAWSQLDNGVVAFQMKLVQKSEATWLYWDGHVDGDYLYFSITRETLPAHSFFDQICEDVHIGYWEYYPNEEHLVWSAETYHIYGLQVGTHISFQQSINFIDEKGRKLFQRTVNNLILLGTDYNMEVNITDAHGQEKWVRIKGTSDRENGKAQLIKGTIQDITQQKEEQLRLSKQVELVEKLFDNLPIMVGVFDPQGQFLMANKSFEETMGWTVEELKHVSLLEKCYPDETYRQGVIDFMMSGVSHWHDFTTHCRSGAIIETSWANVQLSDGSRIGIGQDITMRKRREQAVLENQERLDLAMRGSQDGLWDWNMRTDEVFYGPRFKELLGFTDQHDFPHVLSSWKKRIHPDDQERVQRKLQFHLENHGSYHIEYRCKNKSGVYRWFLDRGRALRDSSGTPYRMAGSITDISDRKIAEEYRNAQQEEIMHLQALLGNIMDMIAIFDTETLTFHYVNLGASLITGYSQTELLQMKPFELDVQLDQIEYRNTFLDPLLSGQTESINQESILRRKDGSQVIVEVKQQLIKIQGSQSFVSVIRDISERKKIDRMKDEFVSTVSHELRTPLTSISGSLTLLDGGVMGELPPAIKNLVHIAANNVDRLIRLINDILDIEKIESGNMVYHMRIEDMVSIVFEAINNNAAYANRFTTTIETREFPVRALANMDRDRILQILDNFLSNAIKFSPQNATIIIRLEPEDTHWFLSVEDQGCGIPESFREHIFEKFSQVDSSDSRRKGGTGLGLSISKAIAEAHNGYIGFKSEVDKGTTFFLRLPRNFEQALP